MNRLLPVLALLSACSAPLQDVSEQTPFVRWELEVGAEAGSVLSAVEAGDALDGESLTVAIRDIGHPARIQSVVCPTDDALEGCPVIDWTEDAQPFVEVAGSRLFLDRDGSMDSAAPDTRDSLALGGAVEWFVGGFSTAVPAGDWTISLPMTHLMGNAPDGQRWPAIIEVRVYQE